MHKFKSIKKKVKEQKSILFQLLKSFGVFEEN